ncbi:MAG: YidC/Oxa1 family membrane protein insertase [Candidatus Aminicenantes bacterium]|jgi:hypothetical protein
MKKKNMGYRFLVLSSIVLLMGIYLHSKTPNPPPLNFDSQPDSRDWSWLSRAALSNTRVSETLNEIWGLPRQEAKKVAYGLRAAWGKASIEGKHAACLMIAAALEKAQKNRLARLTYQQIKKNAEILPYAKSASFRLRLFDEPGLSKPENNEKIYKFIADEADGWFLLPQEKRWIMPREALQPLIENREQDLSFRFFKFLRAHSPFPGSYAFLFIFLVLTIGIKVLELPLYVKTGKAAYQLRGLTPQIEDIRLNSSDFMEAQQRINALYRSHGINLSSGCLVLIVDLIFIIWALISMSSFSPQFIQDGARFLWVTDITQPNLGIIIVCVILSLVAQRLAFSSQQTLMPVGALIFGALISGTIISFIAMHWKWPAYVFIFWILLTIFGILINTGFRAYFSYKESY